MSRAKSKIRELVTEVGPGVLVALLAMYAGGMLTPVCLADACAAGGVIIAGLAGVVGCVELARRGQWLIPALTSHSG